MEKKIVTSAENLAVLDLAIAKKRAPKEEDRAIIVVVGPHYYIFILEGRIAYFDQVSNTARNILPEASVDELVKLRNIVEVK
jgi:hypothetical protein